MKKLFLFFLFLFFSTQVQAISLENYCSDGYYKIPNEKVCSRAPKCGGKSYEEVAALPAPNPQECMGDKDGRTGCQGYVPLCCYEVARTGDPLMCVGYWERLWCHPDQCARIDPEKSRVCNGGQPGTCQCGHAFEFWCQGADAPHPPVPLETRLGLRLPTSTPTPTSTIKPTPTSIIKPTPTSIIKPTPTSIINPTNTPKIEPSPYFTPTPIFFTPTPTKPVFHPTVFLSPTISFYPQVSIFPIPILKQKFQWPDFKKLAEKIKIAYQENRRKIQKEVRVIKKPIVNSYLYIKKIDTRLENFINRQIVSFINQLKQTLGGFD